MHSTHIDWMTATLAEAKTALERGEVPIACLLVSKGQEIGRGYTHVSTHKSMAAHAETLMLLDTEIKPLVDYQPLVLYSTLEPCLMCLGAAVNCGVTTIVYSMSAIHDGSAVFVPEMQRAGRPVPDMISNILRSETEALMHEFLRRYPNHTGSGYVRSLFETETVR